MAPQPLRSARLARPSMPYVATMLEGQGPGMPAIDESAHWDLSSHVDAVLDCLTDHAIAALDAEGNITSWNRAAQTTKLYRRGEVLGKHIGIFYTEADQRNGQPQRDLHMAATNGLHCCEGWRLRKDGKPFWARVVFQLVADAEGNLKGYVMVARDISEHQELLSLREDRERARKVETLGRLAPGLASALGGMLAASAAGHDVALLLAADERAAQAIGAGKEAVARGRKLVGEILGFARRPAACPQAWNLHELISSMEGLITCAAGDQIELNWRLNAGTIGVMVDPMEFQATVLAMVGAAQSVLPHGGVLTVFAEGNALGRNREIAPFARDQVAVGVSLQGNERLPDLLANGAEPHISGGRSGPAAWESFARQAGATPRMENLPGEGLTLKLLFPALAMPAAAGGGSRGARTVLLVDDDTNVLSLVGEMLTFLGHRVVPAQGGSEALAQLRADRSIDCLFTDIVMPAGMNGVELMREARSARPGLRTALASARSRDEVCELGDIPLDVAFFAKPYAMAEINAYLQAA